VIRTAGSSSTKRTRKRKVGMWFLGIKALVCRATVLKYSSHYSMLGMLALVGGSRLRLN
jgi:hypothetical protein